jgi:hypothetical protein
MFILSFFDKKNQNNSVEAPMYGNIISRWSMTVGSGKPDCCSH